MEDVREVQEVVDVGEEAPYLREWVPRDVKDVQTLMLRYASLELHRDPGDVFLHHLLQRRDAWFVEAPFGMFYLTNIVPDVMAEFAMVFWDQRMPGERASYMKRVVQAAFDMFQLERLGAVFPSDIKAQTRFLMKAGWTLEGRLRHSRIIRGEFVDLTVCSVLRDEVEKWPRQTISLELAS